MSGRFHIGSRLQPRLAAAIHQARVGALAELGIHVQLATRFVARHVLTPTQPSNKEAQWAAFGQSKRSLGANAVPRHPRPANAAILMSPTMYIETLGGLVHKDMANGVAARVIDCERLVMPPVAATPLALAPRFVRHRLCWVWYRWGGAGGPAEAAAPVARVAA